jgi:hypothetical protein
MATENQDQRGCDCHPRFVVREKIVSPIAWDELQRHSPIIPSASVRLSLVPCFLLTQLFAQSIRSPLIAHTAHSYVSSRCKFPNHGQSLRRRHVYLAYPPTRLFREPTPLPAILERQQNLRRYESGRIDLHYMNVGFQMAHS